MRKYRPLAFHAWKTKQLRSPDRSRCERQASLRRDRSFTRTARRSTEAYGLHDRSVERED